MSAVCVCVVWTRHRRNTQGDSTAPTEPKNVGARDTKQRPETTEG